MNVQAKVVFVGVGVALVVLVVALVVAVKRAREGPGTRSSGRPTDADYTNVLLEPTLAEEIGLDLPLRLRAATKGARLLNDLRNGSGHGPSLPSGHAYTDRLGLDRVVRSGREARAMLPVGARRAFEKRFEEGELVRVGFWTEKKKGPLGSADLYFLTFGRYEVEKARAGTKSLRACEDELDRCYQWIPSEDEANFLLDHEDEDVRRAAERWWDRREAELDEAMDEASSREAADRIAATVRRDREAFAQNQAELREAQARRAESRERDRQRRAAEREAFRDKVRAEQEAVRRRIEAARQESR